MSESNEFNPYEAGLMAPPATGEPARLSPVRPASEYNPYEAGVMGANRGSLEDRMMPGPVTKTAYRSLPTKDSPGAVSWGGSGPWGGMGVPQDPAAQRIRGAIADAWEKTQAFTPEYQAKMNAAPGPFGWLNRNVINPALNTAAAVPAAAGAGVGATIAELTNEVGAPALGRDINMALAAIPVIGGAIAPVLPRTLTMRPKAQPVDRPIPTTPGNITGPVSKDALAAMEQRRAERNTTMSGGTATPGPEGPASETTFPVTVRGAVPGADQHVRAPVQQGPMAPPPGYVPDVPARTIASEGFDVAHAHYDLADHLGGKVVAKANDTFLDTKVAGIRTQDPVARAFNKADAVDIAIAELDGALRGKDLSLRGAQEIDRGIGDRISEALNNGKREQAERLIKLQHALRDHVESVGEAESGGGPAGFAALKDARKAWAVAVRMRDVERMVEKAEGTLNPQQSMRTQINSYVNNPKMTRGWDPKDLDALKNAARTGNGVEILRTLSSRLVPIGGYAIAGPLGAAVAVGETLLAKQARDALSNVYVKRIQDVVAQQGRHLPGMPGSEIGPPAPPPGVLMSTGQALPQPSQRGLLGTMVLGTDPGEQRRQAEERARLEEQLRLRRGVQ